VKHAANAEALGTPVDPPVNYK